MIIIAIVKASGIRTPVHSFDLVWETFWQQMEACTAVLMVSFTAFRSVFVSNKQKTTPKRASPMIFLQRKIPTLLRTNGSSSGEGGKNWSPASPPPGGTPPPPLMPHKPAPLGRHREVWDTDDSMTTSKGSVGAQTHDLESGIQSKEADSGAFGNWDSGTSASVPGDPEKSSPESGHGGSRKKSDSGHWWRIGLISNFMPSQSTGTGSSDLKTMSSG